jgi:ABC-type sugar transport system permease subunit
MKPKRKLRMTMQTRHGLEALMFLLPWLMGLSLFFIYPVFISLRLSFSEIVQLKGYVMEWVGLENFRHILFWDINFVPMFVTVITDTLINTPITLAFSLVIAILINRPMKGRAFFRTAFFIPVLLGSGYVMKQLLGMGADGRSVTAGIAIPEMIDMLLPANITEVIQQLLDRITIVLWKSGVQIVLFLAGLQGIPSSLYEAARCDGATEWEMFWKVTLPLISPVLLMNLVYTIVIFFTDATNPIVDYILQQTFQNVEFANGAAMSWVYFLFTFIFCVAALAGLRRRVFIMGDRR